MCDIEVEPQTHEENRTAPISVRETIDMSRYYVFGGVFVIVGLLLLIWQGLMSTMTAGDMIWKNVTLVDVINARYWKWVDGISWDMVQGAILYVIGVPLFIVLIVVGVLSFIVGGLVNR
jgi:hypothetical protein